MANKSYKSKNTRHDEYDDEDGDDRKTGKKKISPRRRPTRNWKHAVERDSLDDMNE